MASCEAAETACMKPRARNAALTMLEKYTHGRMGAEASVDGMMTAYRLCARRLGA